MYNTQPTGKYRLTICTCLPCGLQSALDAADHLRDRLGIDFNETTPMAGSLKEAEPGRVRVAPVCSSTTRDARLHDE
jgi:NADH-quinone oxidoreductase subunit E